jgi:hypothetical protein
MDPLYDTDPAAWCDAQVDALRARNWDVLDLEHLIEELEMVKERYVSELENRLRQLLEHLLKLAYAEAAIRRDNARGWQQTCTEQRRRLARRLARTPSLRPGFPTLLADAYDDARLEVLQKLELMEDEQLPATCPWTLEEVMREGYVPV